MVEQEKCRLEAVKGCADVPRLAGSNVKRVSLQFPSTRLDISIQAGFPVSLLIVTLLLLSRALRSLLAP